MACTGNREQELTFRRKIIVVDEFVFFGQNKKNGETGTDIFFSAFARGSEVASGDVSTFSFFRPQFVFSLFCFIFLPHSLTSLFFPTSFFLLSLPSLYLSPSLASLYFHST